jgi:hypothetical protein
MAATVLAEEVSSGESAMRSRFGKAHADEVRSQPASTRTAVGTTIPISSACRLRLASAGAAACHADQGEPIHGARTEMVAPGPLRSKMFTGMIRTWIRLPWVKFERETDGVLAVRSMTYLLPGVRK